MNLGQALELVLNEAEVSAIGENTEENQKVLKAVELIEIFYEEHGHQFENYEVEA